MKAYKFNTKVSQNGIIKIPNKQTLAGKNVEVIIVPKASSKKDNFSAEDFIEKWAGFLSLEKDEEDYKYQYLSKKYK